MTPDEMAQLHALCFDVPRPWGASEIEALLSQDGAFARASNETAFLIGRVLVDTAELLTLATSPNQRRAGLARALLAQFLETARNNNATRAVLEVRADNVPAIALYESFDFEIIGRRKGYYRLGNTSFCDALVYGRAL